MRKRYQSDLIRKRERWNKILELCMFEGRSVPDLAALAFSSKSVIRTDLQAMQKLGYIKPSRDKRSSCAFTLFHSLINKMPEIDLDKTLNDIADIPHEPKKRVTPTGAREIRFDDPYYQKKLADTQKLRAKPKQNVWIGNTLGTMTY